MLSPDSLGARIAKGRGFSNHHSPSPELAWGGGGREGALGTLERAGVEEGIGDPDPSRSR